MSNTEHGSQPIKNEQSGTKELSFEVLKDSILKYKAKSQYIQSSIIILRDIFNDDTIQGANFAKQPHSNEWVKGLLRWLKDNHFLNETEDTLNYIVNNYNPPKK